MQIARYVDGRDTSPIDEVAAHVDGVHGVVLKAEDLTERIRNDNELSQLNLRRMEKTQARMESLGIRGVRQLVAVVNGSSHVLSGEALYRGPQTINAAIMELAAAARNL